MTYHLPYSRAEPDRAWAAPPYREILLKIGKLLGEYHPPPKELPQRLRALLLQIQDDDE
jgi:hypothetical protein